MTAEGGRASCRPPPNESYCGLPFSKTLAAGNATGTISWSVASGALPPGLALDALSGEISGTPASVGSFAFRVRAQDSSGLVERDFVIDVFEGSAFVPIIASPGAVCLGQSATLSVSGSWTSYHWLPGGETSPTVSVSPGETTDYGVLLTDAAGCSARGYGRVSVAPHSVAIQAPPCVSIGGSGYQASVPDAGPGATYTWMIDNGTITAGAGASAITFSAGGATPVRLSVAVMDSGGCFSTGGATLGICESKFYTVAPCRLADTRDGPGPSGGPALAANSVRTFPVTGLCGIPSSATAVALNLAVFVPSNDGDLRVYPGEHPLPWRARSTSAPASSARTTPSFRSAPEVSSPSSATCPPAAPTSSSMCTATFNEKLARVMKFSTAEFALANGRSFRSPTSAGWTSRSRPICRRAAQATFTFVNVTGYFQ